MTQSLGFVRCAWLTGVLVLSHRLSHHARRESLTRARSEQRNESRRRKPGILCSEHVPYLIFPFNLPYAAVSAAKTHMRTPGSAKTFGANVSPCLLVVPVRVCLSAGAADT